MMIKALILIHLWSILIASVAWVLQRDGNGRVGTSFPASNIWLTLIILSFLPGVLYIIPLGTAINLPKIEVLEILPIQATDRTAGGSRALNFLDAYIVLSILLMSRTLWRWSRLQNLALTPTDEPDIFTTNAAIPPLTLSWPKRAVVVPLGFEVQSALIKHERAHLHNNDAELTLFLLLLQDIMLRSPGISYLVRQWRLSIELRADYAATKQLTASERKDYAALLLNVLRSSGRHTAGRKLPCPTAHFTSKHHRSVKMRLTGIMEDKPIPKKRRWGIALLLTTLASSMIGFIGTAASANEEVIIKAADNITYVKNIPPKMPASCSGLKKDDIKIDWKELTVDNKVVQQHTVTFGSVILLHDVLRDGSTDNLRIIYSTHPCFEAGAKASVAQWIVKPQGKEMKNVGMKMYFTITGETHEQLAPYLNKYLQ